MARGVGVHCKQSCAVVTFKNVKASNALLLNPPRQFVNGVSIIIQEDPFDEATSDACVCVTVVAHPAADVYALL